MGNKLLITQALDERQLLIKKIASKIENASFVDVKRENEERVMNGRVSEEDFRKKAESSYQQIMDLIERYQQIDAAIVASNAATSISTSYGIFTVAAAISLRNRLRSSAASEMEFERNLEIKMESEYRRNVEIAETKNKALNETAENMRLSILGNECRGKDEKSLEVVKDYVKENTMGLIDPIGVLEKIEASKLRRNTLLTELETQIKVSNATTFIEV